MLNQGVVEGSKISEFYRDKNILITGATGFVGKLLIDKLLRCSQPRTLYLLIRPKRSVEPQKRLAELFKSPVFNKMKAAVPDYMNRLILVSGDMMEPGLGLADADRKMLVDNIDVVFHGAATVKFDEPLLTATKINVIGTVSILQLCKQMKNLVSLVHVSTAYANCPNARIEEKIYEPPISSEKLVNLSGSLNEQLLELMTPHILGKWPNTYTFTKAVAEDAVKVHGNGLPIAVFRPAMMVSTRREPEVGWIDNLYGPIAMIVGCGAGVLRVVHAIKDTKGDMVPADMTINCLIAVGYNTSLSPPSNQKIPTIYNFTTHNNNKLMGRYFFDTCWQRGAEIPSAKSIWYYSFTSCTSITAYMFLRFIYHIIPAIIVDIGLTVLNKKPRALKIYKKIHKFSELMSYFCVRGWDFAHDNVNSLWHNLDKKDQEIYDFDMESLDWYQFFRNLVDGLRQYILEDDIETVPYARKRMFLLWVLHRTVQIGTFTFMAWGIWHLISFVR